MLDSLSERARAHPDDLLLIDVDGVSYRAGEAHDLALRWATMLEQLGVERGEPVATMLATRGIAVIAWLGCALAGAIEIPINPDYRGAMLRDALAVSTARTLVIEHRLLPWLYSIAGELLGLERVVVVDGDGMEIDYLPWPTVDLRGALAAADPIPRDLPRENAIACGIFTSGTTAGSKCVLVSWAQIGRMYGEAIPLEDHSDGVGYVHTPLHHLVARGIVHRALMRRRGRAVLRRKLDTERFWDDVREHGCTETITTEVVGKWLSLARPQARDADNPLELVVMAPLLPDPHEFAARFDVELLTCYGSTEAGIPFATRGIPREYGSCGRLVAGAEVRVVDPERPDQDLPTGATGELLVRVDDSAEAHGYFNDPAATARSWVDGWFHTGDAFRTSPDGDWFFMGRYKDMIRRRGENVSAAEIEREVQAYTGVAQSAAVGVPSEFGEEEIKLFVEAEPGAALDLELLAAFLARRLPRFMVPRFYERIATLPIGPTAKVDKRALRTLPAIGDATLDTAPARPAPRSPRPS